MSLASRPVRGTSIDDDAKLRFSELWERFFDEVSATPVNATARDGDTKPSVKNFGTSGILAFNNTAPTNVTGFADGLDTQEVVAVFRNGNTTLKNSAAFRLSGGIDVNPPANSTLVMKLDGATWRQVQPVITT